ncbi:MAG: cytochrome c4 [Gammaproteobacteria bacterium]|mgnify:CR=1 FL=1|nr:cytochrome c4 [Gammaproteobacteria bacterium]
MRLRLTILTLAACVAACENTVPLRSATADNDVAAAPAAPTLLGDAERGKTRSAELYCDACHGVNGNSETSVWPSLAGQNARYLVRQMELLRAGARPSPEMQPIAATLSDEDIADLAAHYAAQVPIAPQEAPDETAKAGEALYQKGDPARALPACASCHGASGEGNPATGDPAVRGQQPDYSILALEAYANRTRYAQAKMTGPENENLNIMYEVASKLTPAEIRSVAAYMRIMR